MESEIISTISKHFPYSKSLVRDIFSYCKSYDTVILTLQIASRTGLSPLKVYENLQQQKY